MWRGRHLPPQSSEGSLPGAKSLCLTSTFTFRAYRVSTDTYQFEFACRNAVARRFVSMVAVNSARTVVHSRLRLL